MSALHGAWKLNSHRMTAKDGSTKDFGKNTQGLLIYEKSGSMSVSINRDIEGDKTDFKNVWNSLLFYAGTFEIREDRVYHHVTLASDPKRIGQSLERFLKLEGNILTLEGRGDFGVAKIEWQKVI